MQGLQKQDELEVADAKGTTPPATPAPATPSPAPEPAPASVQAPAEPASPASPASPLSTAEASAMRKEIVALYVSSFPIVSCY